MSTSISPTSKTILDIPPEILISLRSYLPVRDSIALAQSSTLLRKIFGSLSWNNCSIVQEFSSSEDLINHETHNSGGDSRKIPLKALLHPNNYRSYFLKSAVQSLHLGEAELSFPHINFNELSLQELTQNTQGNCIFKALSTIFVSLKEIHIHDLAKHEHEQCTDKTIPNSLSIQISHNHEKSLEIPNDSETEGSESDSQIPTSSTTDVEFLLSQHPINITSLKIFLDSQIQDSHSSFGNVSFSLPNLQTFVFYPPRTFKNAQYLKIINALAKDSPNLSNLDILYYFNSWRTFQTITELKKRSSDHNSNSNKTTSSPIILNRCAIEFRKVGISQDHNFPSGIYFSQPYTEIVDLPQVTHLRVSSVDEDARIALHSFFDHLRAPNLRFLGYQNQDISFSYLMTQSRRVDLDLVHNLTSLEIRARIRKHHQHLSAISQIGALHALKYLSMEFDFDFVQESAVNGNNNNNNKDDDNYNDNDNENTLEIILNSITPVLDSPKMLEKLYIIDDKKRLDFQYSKNEFEELYLSAVDDDDNKEKDEENELLQTETNNNNNTNSNNDPTDKNDNTKKTFNKNFIFAMTLPELYFEENCETDTSSTIDSFLLELAFTESVFKALYKSKSLQSLHIDGQMLTPFSPRFHRLVNQDQGQDQSQDQKQKENQPQLQQSDNKNESKSHSCQSSSLNLVKFVDRQGLFESHSKLFSRYHCAKYTTVVPTLYNHFHNNHNNIIRDVTTTTTTKSKIMTYVIDVESQRKGYHI